MNSRSLCDFHAIAKIQPKRESHYVYVLAELWFAQLHDNLWNKLHLQKRKIIFFVRRRNDGFIFTTLVMNSDPLTTIDYVIVGDHIAVC